MGESAVAVGMDVRMWNLLIFEKDLAVGHTVNLIRLRRAIIVKSHESISSPQRTMAFVAIFQMRLAIRVKTKELTRLHASKLKYRKVLFSSFQFLWRQSSVRSALVLDPFHRRYHVDRLCEQKLPLLNPGF